MKIRLHRLATALVDFAFPLRCTGCGAWDTLLCDRCRADLPTIEAPFCSRCGIPQPDGPYGVCPECQRTPFRALDAARACFRFDGIESNAVHDLKYRSVSALAEPLGQMLGETLRAAYPDTAALVPVPLHPVRQRTRGYNQATLLAHAAAVGSGLPVLEHALRRVRVTPSQTAFDGPGRRQNVRDAFAQGELDVAGLDVVLIDDVVTTGATMDACAAVLKAAGAKSVRGFALAREL